MIAVLFFVAIFVVGSVCLVFDVSVPVAILILLGFCIALGVIVFLINKLAKPGSKMQRFIYSMGTPISVVTIFVGIIMIIVGYNTDKGYEVASYVDYSGDTVLYLRDVMSNSVFIGFIVILIGFAMLIASKMIDKPVNTNDQKKDNKKDCNSENQQSSNLKKKKLSAVFTGIMIAIEVLGILLALVFYFVLHQTGTSMALLIVTASLLFCLRILKALNNNKQ